jgi:hypothetical protein
MFIKSQVQYSKTQFSLLLIHLACQISIRLFGKSISSIYVSTSLLVDKLLQTVSSQVYCSRKSEKQYIKSLTFDDLYL